MDHRTIFRSHPWRRNRLRMKAAMGKAALLLAILLLLYTASPAVVLADDVDFVGTFWRTDISTSVPYSDNYLLGSAPLGYIVNHGGDWTAGWLSVNLDNQQGDFGLAFSQVGVMTIAGELRWFVYTEPGVTCLDPGAIQVYGFRGCAGTAYVALNQTSYFTIVLANDGYWYFLVYGPSGGSPHVVARVNQSSAYQYPRIYGAQATAEEYYFGGTDPILPIAFYFTHPKYSPDGFTYADWVGSGGVCPNPLVDIYPYPDPRDCLFTRDNNYPAHPICPYYAGAMYVNGDSRQWFGGTGYNSNACGFTFF